MKVFSLYTDCTSCAVLVDGDMYRLTLDDATWLTEEDALMHQQIAKDCGLNCHLRQVDEDIVSSFTSLLKQGIEGPSKLQPKKICDLLLTD